MRSKELVQENPPKITTEVIKLEEDDQIKTVPKTTDEEKAK